MPDDDYLGDKPQTRDLSQYSVRLSSWVERELSSRGKAKLGKLEPTPPDANGFAGESFITEIVFDGSNSKTYLLKRKPTEHLYFPEHDFEGEFRVQELLSKTGHAPVAHVEGYETDPSVLGAPFYLLEFVDGRPTPDRPSYFCEGWLTETSADMQRKICLSGIKALAQLHSKTIKALGAEFLSRAGSDDDQLNWDLGYWDRFNAATWSEAPFPIFSEARSWLDQNKPAPSELVISWGDARPGNMMFDGSDCRAIIDWDMVSAGDPEKDLGYWLAMDLQFERVADQIAGGSKLTGWLTREEMVDVYQNHSDRDVDQMRLRFYRIFAAYQIASMYSRYILMRSELDETSRAQYLNEMAPPIALIKTELEAAHLPGNAN